MAEDNVKRIHGTREIQQNQRLNEPLFIKGEEKIDAVLENESNFGRFDGLDISGKKEKEENVKKELERRIKKIAQDTTNAEKNNGILRRGFSWVKNLKWIDKISNSTNDVIVAQAEELNSLNGENISKIFLETTGFEYNDENIEKFLNGEILTKSEEALKKYKEGQENFSEFGSDMASTMLATTAFTAAGAFIAALGAPVLLVGAGAIAVASAVGAGTKVAGNALAANNANEEYDSLTKDLLLGAVNGALAPLTAIGGGKIASKIVTSKLLGGTATKAITKGAQKATAEGIEELAERGTQKASTLMTDILNPYGYQYGGSNLIKGIGYSTEFIFDGSISGAADAAVRTAYDGGTSEDILKSAGQGALFGTVGALGFGWGFKGLGSMAHNWGYDKGIEVKGDRSINDQALIDAGGNPSKRYHIPQPKDNSGTLYSGLPIMEIARFLGKSPNFKTLDDVAEDYLIHKFYSMKRYAPELYREIMNGADGATHALDDIELTPQRFVEDVLFSEEPLLTFDFFEFKKFKRKFNKESLNENLEDLLRCYEMTNPEIHSTTQAKNVVDDISSKPVIEDKPATPKAEEAPVKPADTEADSTPTKPADTGNNETPTESGSGSPIQSSLTEKKLKEKALEDIRAKKGVQSQAEYFLREEIVAAYKVNDIEIHKDLVEIFNLYCGVMKSVEGNKEIAAAFEVEYKAAKNNPDKLKEVIQKFKNLTDEQKLEIVKQTKGKTDSPSPRVAEGGNNDGKNLDIVDSEGLQGPKTDETGNASTGTEPKPVPRMAQISKIITETLDKILIDFRHVDFLENLDEKRIEKIAKQYLINQNSKGVLYQVKTKDPLSESLLEAENIISILKKHENNNKRLTDNKDNILNVISTTKQTIKVIQNEYRANLVLKILKNLDDSSITPAEILEVVSKKYNFSKEDSKAVLKIVETKIGIEEFNLKDFFTSKSTARARFTTENIELADVLIEIKKHLPDFDPNKYKPDELEAFNNFYKIKSKNMKMSDIVKIYDRFNGEIPLEKLFDENGSIFDILYPFDSNILERFLDGKGNTKNYKGIILRQFTASEETTVKGLRQFYNDNKISRLVLTDIDNIRIEFTGEIPIKDKIKLLRNIFQKFHKLSIDDVANSEITFEGFMDELAARQLKDIQTYSQENSYYNIYRLLEISPNFREHDKFEMIGFFDLSKTQKEIIERLCQHLSDPKFDIFIDRHARLRFLERVVLAENRGLKNIDDVIKKIDDTFELLVKKFETQDLTIEEYASSKTTRGRVVLEWLDPQKPLRISFTSNNRIKTLFFDRHQ